VNLSSQEAMRQLASWALTAIGEQTSVTSEITSAVTQSTRGSREISDMISSIADKAVENKAVSADMHESADQLATTASELQTHVNRFVKDPR